MNSIGEFHGFVKLKHIYSVYIHIYISINEMALPDHNSINRMR